MSNHNTPLAVNTGKKQADRLTCSVTTTHQSSIAERRLAQAFGIMPSHARLIAELQGYGVADG